MCGWHIVLSLHNLLLSFWNRHDRSGTHTHTHTVVSSPFIPWPIVCKRQSPRSYFLSLHNFFFSHGARMKRNKRFRHCTYNLSVPPPFSPFLFCSVIIMLFIYLRRLRTISIRRSMLLLRRGKHIRSPPGLSFSFVWHWQSHLNVIDSVWHTIQTIEFNQGVPCKSNSRFSISMNEAEFVVDCVPSYRSCVIYYYIIPLLAILEQLNVLK